MIVVVVGPSVTINRHLGALPRLLWVWLHLRIKNLTCCILVQ